MTNELTRIENGTEYEAALTIAATYEYMLENTERFFGSDLQAVEGFRRDLKMVRERLEEYEGLLEWIKSTENDEPMKTIRRLSGLIKTGEISAAEAAEMFWKVSKGEE